MSPFAPEFVLARRPSRPASPRSFTARRLIASGAVLAHKIPPAFRDGVVTVYRIGFEPMTFRSQSEHATAASSSPEYHIASFSNKQLTINLSKNYRLSCLSIIVKDFVNEKKPWRVCMCVSLCTCCVFILSLCCTPVSCTTVPRIIVATARCTPGYDG